jgi:hypothetical protein
MNVYVPIKEAEGIWDLVVKRCNSKKMSVLAEMIKVYGMYLNDEFTKGD